MIFIDFNYYKSKPVKDDIGCQCALSETCKTFEKPTLCNCDSRGFNVTDVGVLSSDHLPIYGIYHGGSHTPYSFIKYDIGPLICSGKKGFYPSETGDIEKELVNSRLNELKNEMKEIKENLSEISDQLDEHLSKIYGPISIERNNLMSKLNYSDDYEISFEYKASVIPSSGWHQILSGSLITFIFHILNFRT